VQSMNWAGAVQCERGRYNKLCEGTGGREVWCMLALSTQDEQQIIYKQAGKQKGGAG